MDFFKEMYMITTQVRRAERALADEQEAEFRAAIRNLNNKVHNLRNAVEDM